ncbi:hypothetical protein INT48_000493 [Thamnidium elegans]|uniref:NAD-dependent epimerase/dehydratase domain-containing protein n=1 Tax=Thamnidium elegans TaxID=101142 RepID=A0A8H7VVD4_9FUNG|nr:hypothetical protein INT48_000493 [Thamnidium elegans]
MAQPIARKLLVVGGSGFLGSNICKLAANKGWETVSLSRKGEPELFNQYGKPEWAEKVQWASGNSLEPESYKDLLKGVTNVVHSVGILMENDYKSIAQAQSLCEVASAVPRLVLGMNDQGNPLDPKLRDLMTIADQVAKLCSIRTFTYISASDVFPLIDPRYITTKREAERYLFRHDEFKTTVLRPVTSPFKKGIASLPGGKLITTPPLQTEQVARAVIASIETEEHGIFDVEGIEKLSRVTI